MVPPATGVDPCQARAGDDRGGSGVQHTRSQQQKKRGSLSSEFYLEPARPRARFCVTYLVQSVGPSCSLNRPAVCVSSTRFNEQEPVVSEHIAHG